MNDAGKYILSVGIAALIAGILTGFTDCKSTSGVLLRMVCSLFLAIVVIKPFSNLRFSYLNDFLEEYESSSQAAASIGMQLADEAQREIIKSEAEAYILDKAGSYGLELQAEVTLTEGDVPIPETVHLMGAASPYARVRLQMMIADELGIPKERQQWTG